LSNHLPTPEKRPTPATKPILNQVNLGRTMCVPRKIRNNQVALEKASTTAIRAALYRAAHQLFDDPVVFRDAVAVEMLHDDERNLIMNDPKWRTQKGLLATLRISIALRSHYAEDKLKDAVEKGIRQYVILGAGLDTFAYRNPWRFLKVFEVDHPMTQADKRDRLQGASIHVAPNVAFVPIDFQTQTLPDALVTSGFDADLPSFFSWLGVTYYLPSETVIRTLKVLASMNGYKEIVFDYAVSLSDLPDAVRHGYEILATGLEKLGEPSNSPFSLPTVRPS
jgi:methyltransferase (TIGR00027 family)